MNGKAGGGRGDRGRGALVEGEHQLADVVRLRHGIEGITRAGNRIGRQWQRAQLLLRKQRHDFAQERRDHGRAPEGQPEQVHRKIGQAVLEGLKPNLGVLINISLADFQETTVRGEQRQAVLNGRAGERVQHHVHPSTAAGRAECVGEAEAARIGDVGDAERLEKLTLGRAAGRGEHFRAGALGNLERRQPGAAGRRMDQHALAGLQVGEVVQRVIGT